MIRPPMTAARLFGFATTVSAALILISATPALATVTLPPSGAVGNDISYPQCGGAFPKGGGFGVAGVNDGRPGTSNPCLGPDNGGPATSELAWASGFSPNSAQLYVNTADPGNSYHHQLIADWPTSNVSADPYTCSTTVLGHGKKATTVGDNSPGCAWQYGYDRAQQDLGYLSDAVSALTTDGGTADGNASDHLWWLDVETANTWQSGSNGQAMNLAVLQGMTYVFEQLSGAPVGVYSTSYQWGQIVGSPTDLGNVAGLPDWIPGASNQTDARASICSLQGFTGSVLMAQWTATYDDDLVC